VNLVAIFTAGLLFIVAVVVLTLLGFCFGNVKYW